MNPMVDPLEREFVERDWCARWIWAGAPARHDLGSTARDQIEKGKVLEDADRNVRAKHGDCGAQPN